MFVRTPNSVGMVDTIPNWASSLRCDGRLGKIEKKKKKKRKEKKKRKKESRRKRCIQSGHPGIRRVTLHPRGVAEVLRGGPRERSHRRIVKQHQGIRTLRQQRVCSREKRKEKGEGEA